MSFFGLNSINYTEMAHVKEYQYHLFDQFILKMIKINGLKTLRYCLTYYILSRMSGESVFGI